MSIDNEFRLYREIVNYSNYIRQYVLSTITNVNRDLRIHLMDEVYYLERNLVSAQSTKGNIRMKYITEMIINEKMLDIISNDIMLFCPKSKKKLEKSFAYLLKIKNMTYAWRDNPEVNEKNR